MGGSLFGEKGLRRYWYEGLIEVNQAVLIEGEVYKHIFVVCRRSQGDQFELLNSEGKIYLVEVKKLEKNSAEVVVLSERKTAPLPTPHIELALAFPKPQVFERVVEKAVELGVKKIIPLASDFSFFKSREKIDLKRTRALKIVRQACQQSGRTEMLDLGLAQSLEDYVDQISNDPEILNKYFFYESGVDEESNLDIAPRDGGRIVLLVGPEGGFSEGEASKVLDKQFQMIYLGAQVLRVETACVAGISILKSKWGLWV